MTSEKISIYLPTLSAGGAERVMVNLANGLSEKGYDIELVVGNREGGFAGELEASVSVVDLGVPDPPVVGVFASLPYLYQYFERENPRVVLSSMNHINVVVLLALKLSSATSVAVITEHNDPVVLSEHSPKNRIVYRLASVEYPWADEIVAVSEGVAANLSEVVGIPSEGIEVIYNPVVTDELIEKSHEAADHRWFDGEAPVVLTVGRLSKQKNQELLLRTHRELREGTDAKLLIIGQGGREARLRRLAAELGIEDDVEIINWVDNPYAYMANADVFVLTSLWEGLPTVLIEALACHCPVVSADCPSGPREILRDGEYGELVESYTPGAFVSAIYRMLEDPPSDGLMTKRAQEFTSDKCIKQYERIVSRHLSRHD
jgi:glycosyltransferase involved in cell wall biosynthesis